MWYLPQNYYFFQCVVLKIFNKTVVEDGINSSQSITPINSIAILCSILCLYLEQLMSPTFILSLFLATVSWTCFYERYWPKEHNILLHLKYRSSRL